MQNVHGRTSVFEVALAYAKRGWSVVPVPYRSKGPVIDNWQNLRITPNEIAQFFVHKQQNVGVLQGEPSQWLVDVDLDHPLSRPIAEKSLPETGCIFGRAGNPRSHWLYYASCPVETRQWRLPDRRMVVELRSTGAQTVFPGSVHASGERIEWEKDSIPSVIDPTALMEVLQVIYDEVCQRLNISKAIPRTTHGQFEHAAPRNIIERARKYLFAIPPAISGQGGHNTTYMATCRLVLGFGLGRSDALALLVEWNETCDPPWTLKELEHKVDDALKEPGWRGYLLNSGDCPTKRPVTNAIERANRHAIEHRRRVRRRSRT